MRIRDESRHETVNNANTRTFIGNARTFAQRALRMLDHELGHDLGHELHHELDHQLNTQQTLALNRQP